MTQPIDFRAHPLAGYSLLTHPIHSRSSTSGHWILKEGINILTVSIGSTRTSACIVPLIADTNTQNRRVDENNGESLWRIMRLVRSLC